MSDDKLLSSISQELQSFLAEANEIVHIAGPKRIQRLIDNDPSENDWEGLHGILKSHHLKENGDESAASLFAEKSLSELKSSLASSSKSNNPSPEEPVGWVVDEPLPNIKETFSGNRPFERVPIQWSNPLEDVEFGRELYDFVSCGFDFPDVDIDQSCNFDMKKMKTDTKLLPRDIIDRLSTPYKKGQVDDFDDWEYSATHSAEDEMQQKIDKEESENFRRQLKCWIDIIGDGNNSLDDSEEKKLIARFPKGQKCNIDVRGLFQMPIYCNQLKLQPVRSDFTGNIVNFEETLKTPDEMIAERELRAKAELWMEDDPRVDGPKPFMATWEPINTPQDPDSSKNEILMKKRENIIEVLEDHANPKEVVSHSITSKADPKLLEEFIQNKLLEIQEQGSNPKLIENLKCLNINIQNVAERLEKSYDILENTDFKFLRKKDKGKPYPLENDTVEMDDENYVIDVIELDDEVGPLEINKDDSNGALFESKEKMEGIDTKKTGEKMVEGAGKGSAKVVNPDVLRPVSLNDYEKDFLKTPYYSSKIFNPDIRSFENVAEDHPVLSSWMQYCKEAEGKGNLELLNEAVAAQNGIVDDPFSSDEEEEAIEKELTEMWKEPMMSETSTSFQNIVNKVSLTFPTKDTFTPGDEAIDEEVFRSLTEPAFHSPLVDSVKFNNDPFIQDTLIEETMSSKREKTEESASEKQSPFTSEKDDKSFDLKGSSEPDDASSDEETDEQSTHLTLAPIKPGKVNVKENLLFATKFVIANHISGKTYSSRRIHDWIEGTYIPSPRRIEKWTEEIAEKFPNVIDCLKCVKDVIQENEKTDPDFEEGLTASSKDPSMENVKDEMGNSGHVFVLGSESSKVGRSKGLKWGGRDEQWAVEVDISRPPDMSSIKVPAMNFPFVLDNFQKHAIHALEQGHNVFVAAHTSAGKTVVAEYAIAMSRRNRSRAIYTSPVKALSNQKFNDFKQIFDSVGLITGDLQLNDTAECLIMTTEILRSMLYNCSERIRELEFVIFDEVHYFNNPERGHVWEESLILLPSSVQIVMLSATVPNTLEFASWIGRHKSRKVIVSKTLHRPVPLKHYLYVDPADLKGGTKPADSFFLLKEGDSPVIHYEYERANELLKLAAKKDKRPFTPVGNYKKRNKARWLTFIHHLQNCDWLPCVVFAFSRKKCDELAIELGSALNLTTQREKFAIQTFVKRHIMKLDDVDQQLPQLNLMSTQLVNGVGVHHSGILPILKEIVEVLFQEGKVKILFATETFAMGVNMPARTVVFNSIQKFDGTNMRTLVPAEYIQMAGRAGRRGKDEQGNVIIWSNGPKLLPMINLECVLSGCPKKLESQFRITYRMILNTLTTRGTISAQAIMDTSFCENSEQLKKMKQQEDLKLLKASEVNDADKIKRIFSQDVMPLIREFYDEANLFIGQWSTFLRSQVRYDVANEMCLGKVIIVTTIGIINKPAIVVDIADDSATKEKLYTITYLKNSEGSPRDFAPVKKSAFDEKMLAKWYKMVSLFPIALPQTNIVPEVLHMATIKVSDVVGFIPVTVCSFSYAEVGAIYSDLRSIKVMGVEYSKFISSATINARLQLRTIGPVHLINIYKNSSISSRAYRLASDLPSSVSLSDFEVYFLWREKQMKINEIHGGIDESYNSLYSDYERKLAVLRDLNHLSATDLVQTKGFMAAKLSKYELIVTELLTENIIADLTPAEVAALLSFLVYQGRGTSEKENEPLDPKKTDLSPTLCGAVLKTEEIVQRIRDIEKSYEILFFETSEGITRISYDLTTVMYAWANGNSFKQVMELSNNEFQEGILVRWIQQLLEVLKEVESAAKVMGDSAIPTKIHEAGLTIKRGIVFAPSLYTAND